ncbi:MAG: discoidin domain-containing protein, partial [Planctomycetes bacterium]|nr:discoidin domain-containing protein [Planctomycetota bacterium]
MRMLFSLLILVLGLGASVVVLGESPSGRPGKSPRPSATSPEQIEADWLLQAKIRSQSGPIRKNTPIPFKITAEQDAAGGCDGVKDGSWGFHTDLDDKPWWHVDLGKGMPLARTVIFNTGYVEEWKRALGFVVLLSDDGKTWTEVFRHDGKEFEHPKKPITVELKGAQARFVRIQLPVKQHLTLDEVEVYAVDGNVNVALNRPANQSSSSKYSVLDYNPWSSRPVPQQPTVYPVTTVIQRGLKLADDLSRRGVDVDAQVTILKQIIQQSKNLPVDVTEDDRRQLYLEASWAIRKMALANPLLDFDKLLFA